MGPHKEIFQLEINSVVDSLSHIKDHHYVDRLTTLLQSHESLFATSVANMGHASLVRHRIETIGPPISLPLRRTPERLKAVVQSQMEDMHTNGVIRRVII